VTIRTFVFCDACNPQATRYVEQRRSASRGDHGGCGGRRGRRATDGRAWFEGAVHDAEQAGWRVTREGRHLCPACGRGEAGAGPGDGGG